MFVVPGFTAPLVSLFLALQPPVSVQGATACPTPVEVASRLERLLAPGSAGVEPDRAQLRAVADGVRIELRRPDGGLVGERTLALGPSCDDLAEALAVVVVIWELPLRPGRVPPLEPVAVPAPVPDLQAQARKEARAAGRWHFEPGAAFQALLPGVVPGVLIEGVVRDTTRRWGARVAFGGAWWSDAALGPGQVSWTRTTMGLGLMRGWSGARLFVDLRGQVLAGALVAAGHGFDQMTTAVTFDAGAGAGLRAGTRLGRRFGIWVDAGVTYWPVDQQIQVDGVPEMVGATRFETAVSLGGTFLGDR
jgi:hypothetical protein